VVAKAADSNTMSCVDSFQQIELRKRACKFIMLK